MTASGRTAFPGFVLLYGALYGAYGTESPFLPGFLAGRGLSPEEIGVVLAAGTLVRLGAGPLAGHLADRLGAPRGVLGIAALLSGFLAFTYLGAQGLGPLVAVSMAHAAATAPLAPLADALALAAAGAGRGFAYGWVRGAGSAAFILGTLASGWVVARAGLDSIVASSGVLFLAAALATRALPARGTGPGPSAPARESAAGAVGALLAIPAFRRVALVGALVVGSHAVHDAFAVIRWREAGVGPGAAGLLWSTAVAAEVVVFLALGPPLVARFGPAACAAAAALAGVLRWAGAASTVSVPALAVLQLGHGATFALLHLAAMRVLAVSVPERLAATAQTLYGTFGLGLASALLTLAAGPLYARLGPGAYGAMAGLCLLALPLAATMRAEGARPAAPSARAG